MRIQEVDKYKTAFQTNYDRFEYLIMFFGLSNALANFQDYINKILAEKFNLFLILIYIAIFTFVSEDCKQ